MLQIRWDTCSAEKLFKRAFRGHLLLENALNAILAADAFNLSLPKACFAKNYEERVVVKDRRQTVPVLDSVVVERDVLNVADTEPVNRGDRSQTLQVYPTALWLSAMFSMLKTQSQRNSATQGKQFQCPTELWLSAMFDMLTTQRQ